MRLQLLCAFAPRQTFNLSQPPNVGLDIVLQAVNNTNSQNLIQKPINAKVDLVNLLEPILKVHHVHLRSPSKARAARSNNILILVIASENHGASRRNVGSALNGEKGAAKVKLLQIESAAVFGSDGVVAAAGQITDDAEYGDVGLTLGVQTLALEELLRQTEGVVGELFVGTDFLGGSGRVADGDIVELYFVVRANLGHLAWVQLTSAMTSELWELDCAGRALTPKAAAQEARRNLEAGLENMLIVIQESVLLEMLSMICVVDVLKMILMSQELSTLLYS